MLKFLSDEEFWGICLAYIPSVIGFCLILFFFGPTDFRILKNNPQKKAENPRTTQKVTKDDGHRSSIVKTMD